MDILGKLSLNINVDSEIDNVRRKSELLLHQELGFAGHLGLPALMLHLFQPINANLAHILYNKFINGANYQMWIHLPMVHPSNYSPLCLDEEKEDMWEWWNSLRTYCHYDKHVNLALELPESKYLPPANEIDRWIGEPVKVLIISTTLFLLNQHKQPVLSRTHQEVIQKFMNLDVQYIIKGPRLHGNSYKQYNAYINHLGKKLYKSDAMTNFVQG